MATGRPNRILIGSSAFNIVMLAWGLSVWTNPPIALWILGIIGIGASSVGIISEIRRAKRESRDPWGLARKAGPLPPEGRPWGVTPNPWE